MSYEERFPSALGPPPVPSGGGPKLLEAREPVYILELDSGAYRAVWELVEAEAKHRYPTHETLSGTRALLRAVDDFRVAYWAVHAPNPSSGSNSRKLARPGRDAPAAPPLVAERPASKSRKRIIPRPTG